MIELLFDVESDSLFLVIRCEGKNITGGSRYAYIYTQEMSRLSGTKHHVRRVMYRGWPGGR